MSQENELTLIYQEDQKETSSEVKRIQKKKWNYQYTQRLGTVLQ